MTTMNPSSPTASPTAGQNPGAGANALATDSKPNPILRKLSPSATKMIRADHTTVMALFHKIDPDLADGPRAATMRHICTALEIHAQLEEEIFYPALRAAGVESAQLDESVPQHDEMRSLIQQVRSAEGQRAAQEDALYALMNAVMHHVADEETQLLPAAERFMGSERLADLGARMTARRLELSKPRAGEMAADLVRGAPGKTALMTVGALVAGTILVSSMRRRGSGHDWR